MSSLNATRSLQRLCRNINVAKHFSAFSSSLQGPARFNITEQSRMGMAKSIGTKAIPTPKLTTRSFSSTAEISDKVKSIIESNKVAIFSKSYCPYCTATKRLFDRMGVDFEVIELDELHDGHGMQNELHKLSGQRSVPNVYINGEHLGGNDVTQAAARSGKLQKMLEIN